MPYKILVINPGSTSTKLSLFEDEREVFTTDVFHDSKVLREFKTINDQLDYRLSVIKDFIMKNDIDLSEIAAIACRGGASYSLKSGTYLVDDLLIEDTRLAKGGLYHASMLGVQMAKAIQKMIDVPIYMSDPTVVDEYDDLARITGLKGVYRQAVSHVLNQKAVARMYASDTGRKYEDLDLIVCHIDGGITINAHHLGRMIDGFDGGGGEGPFTPTRIGSIALTSVIDKLWDKSKSEMKKLTSVSGGLSSYFDTSNSDVIHKLVLNGDKKAVLIWRAMIYQIAKAIGSMACVLKGHVDAIILTGGLMRFDDIHKMIEEHCAFIAPIVVYKGEYEQVALAYNALKVLKGEKEALRYTGESVFKGFDELA